MSFCPHAMNEPPTSTPCDDDAPADAEPPQRLTVEIVIEAGDWSRFGAVSEAIERAADALARAPGLAIGDAEACVALSSDRHVAALNATYRGKPGPTNVLSFPADGPRPPGARRYLGDVVLAAETVAREAAEQGIPPVHHLQHLVVHGLLHLIGLDHDTEAAAAEMEGLETAILGRLGIADPYAAPATT